MDWQKRSSEDMFKFGKRECPPYSAYKDFFTIKLYHGGEIDCLFTKYVGGKVDFIDFCDKDRISLIEIGNMVLECANQKGFAVGLYYKLPTENFGDGIKLLETDNDVLDMVATVPEPPVIEVFVMMVRPISIEGLPLRQTPTKPNPADVSVLDDEEDHVSDGLEGLRRMEDKIREEEGIPKTFSDVEFEKKEKCRLKMKKRKGKTVQELSEHVDVNEDGVQPHETEADLFDVDEVGSWHDDSSNKDKSDDEGDFMVPQVTNECSFYDHAHELEFDSMPHPVTEEETVILRAKKKERKQRKRRENEAKKIKNKNPDVQNETAKARMDGSDMEGGFSSSDYGNSEDERMAVSSDDELDCPFPEFDEKTDMFHPKFELGMLFSSANVLRQAIRTQAIVERRPIRRTPNMGSKVQFVCAPPCDWKIYASKCQRSDSYQIKIYHRNHTCQQTYRQEQISAAWIAWKYEDDIRMNVNWEVEAFHRKVVNDLQCEVTASMVYSAKKLALKVIKGDHAKQYAQLWDYLNEVRRVMPGSTCLLECEENEPGEDRGRFKRSYICLAPVRKGFLEGCRPIIGLDGCHLKGPFGGQLLSAVGIDANDGMYPLAWAVVDVENTVNWDWFVKLLKEDTNMQNSGSYTFISDKQKGLINALEENCPDAEHRFCVMHLYRNMYKDHKGMALRMLLWSAARSTTDYFFEKNMNQLKLVWTLDYCFKLD